jgi:hypothetical protein
MGTGLFPEVKWLEHGVNHPPPSIAEVEERLELYFNTPSLPSLQGVGLNLPFTQMKYQ